MADDILLIAPDDERRRLAEAALRREGLGVTAIEAFPDADLPSPVRAACTIVDGATLPQVPYVAIAMCMRFYPVVLIDGADRVWLHEWVSGVVSDLGATADLVRAVRGIIAVAA